MKTSSRCGTQLDDDALTCSICGLNQEIPQNAEPIPTQPVAAQPTAAQPAAPNYNAAPGNGIPPMTTPADAPNTGLLVLSFFFPQVGLTLYLVWKDQMPLKAKSAGKGALIRVCVGVGISILFFILEMILLSIGVGFSSFS